MTIKTHKIKLKIDFCDAVLCGDKNFEIRNNDRVYQRGDIIQFIPVDVYGCSVEHTIRHHKYLITYVLSGWGLKEEYVAFGIKEISSDCEQDQALFSKGEE